MQVEKVGREGGVYTTVVPSGVLASQDAEICYRLPLRRINREILIMDE